MKTMESPIDEDHENTVQTDSSAHITSKMSRNLESPKAHILISDSKGVWELSSKFDVFPTKIANTPPINNLAKVPVGLKSAYGEMFVSSLRLRDFVCSTVCSAEGISCSYLMLPFRQEVEGRHFMRFHWQGLNRNCLKSSVALFVWSQYNGGKCMMVALGTYTLCEEGWKLGMVEREMLDFKQKTQINQSSDGWLTLRMGVLHPELQRPLSCLLQSVRPLAWASLMLRNPVFVNSEC